MNNFRRSINACGLQQISQLTTIGFTNYSSAVSIVRHIIVKKQSETVDVPKKKEKEGQLVGRDVLSLKHFGNDDIKQILWTAKDLKTRIKDNGEIYQPLQGKALVLILHKQNLHVRLATELGMSKLGGHVCLLGADDIHLDINESVKDSARVLAGMANIILASAPSQDTLEELAKESNVPVICGSSSLLHPLQILAYFLTLQEYFNYLRGLKIAWVGPTSNVLHSLMIGCAKLGIDLSVATPVGCEPDAGIIADSMKMAIHMDASFLLGNDPVRAAYRADVIITDTWINGDQGNKKENKLQNFPGYQINRKMLKEAGGDWVFLHSLPCDNNEVTGDILYGKESLVWKASENRMWTVMAVMLHLLQPYKPTIPLPKYVRG